MDRSLFWFIVCFSALLSSWILFLFLSTCLGEPLRALLSDLWTKLLEYADKQPSHAKRTAGNNKWSRREGNVFKLPYTRLGGRKPPMRNGSRDGGLDEEEEEEMELLDWKARRAAAGAASGRRSP